MLLTVASQHIKHYYRELRIIKQLVIRELEKKLL